MHHKILYPFYFRSITLYRDLLSPLYSLKTSRATKCGQHSSLEILITNVELLEMTFTAASHMNTVELRASAAQL